MLQGCVIQDASDVKTKFDKTSTTTFFPVDYDYLQFFRDWVDHLLKDRLFGSGAPRFPSPQWA